MFTALGSTSHNSFLYLHAEWIKTSNLIKGNFNFKLEKWHVSNRKAINDDGSLCRQLDHKKLILLTFRLILLKARGSRSYMLTMNACKVGVAHIFFLDWCMKRAACAITYVKWA